MGYLFLSVPLTIFVLFVLPIWLWLHYGNRQQSEGVLRTQEQQRLHRLNEEAQRMRQRISALEAILDEENPKWRDS